MYSMNICYSHVQNDSTTKRTGFSTPQVKSKGSACWLITVRLSNAGDPACSRTSDIGRIARTTQFAEARTGSCISVRRSSPRTGSSVIVVDSSIVLEVLLRTDSAPEIEHRIFSRKETLHAPHLIDLEVAQVIRRYTAAGNMTSGRGLEAILDFLDFPITRYSHEIFLTRIWQLRGSMTSYDAAYVTLSEALSAPLLTKDARLATSSGHRARIVLVQ